MSIIAATEVWKSFPASRGHDPLMALRNFSVEINEGELMVFFGPNGCGKTTILNLFAGILPPDSGVIRRPNGELSVGYVFQNHADTLLPWRTVRSNIAYPLELRQAEPQPAKTKIDEVLERFGLVDHQSKYVYQLSGGLRQLTAIAVASVYEPKLLLLDEPFSSLDYSICRGLWTRFRNYCTDSGMTSVFVSHNVDEAVFLADRVCVLSARPAQIVRIVEVPFGRKRELDLLTSPEFFAIRTKVLAAFEEKRSK